MAADTTVSRQLSMRSNVHLPRRDRVGSAPWLLARPWLRLGAVRVLLPVMLVLAAAQSALPGSVTAPQMRAVEDVDAPTALIFATIAGITLAYTIVEPSEVVWQLGAPSRRWGAQLRVVFLMTAYAAVVGIGSSSQLPATLSVLLTSVGEALIATAVIGYRLAWIVPGIHAAAAGLLGAQVFGQLSWWAWPANPDPRGISLSVAALLALTGLVCVRRYGTSGAILQT